MDGFEDRPRERLAHEDVSSLSDIELIALVLRTGARGRSVCALATSVRRSADSLASLADRPPTKLVDVNGIGPAKAASLVAALELGRRSLSKPLARGELVKSPEDVKRHFWPRLRRARRESFHVVLLDARHRLMNVAMASVGTLTASLVHPREVFRDAVRHSAAAVLLVHNHPSGDPTPSEEDRRVTTRLEAAGELLGIRVIDHVIIAEDGYFSFQEESSAFDSRTPDSNPNSPSGYPVPNSQNGSKGAG